MEKNSSLLVFQTADASTDHFIEARSLAQKDCRS
jgi:hypothetical protein